MKTEIYLRRKNKIIIGADAELQENIQYIGTMLKNTETLGYSFTKDLIDILQTKTQPELQAFYLEIIPLLKKMVGAHVKYAPVYPNFPQQVMDASKAELYINAIIHYWSGGKLLPDYKIQERLPLFENNKIKYIGVGDEDDFNKIFTNLMQSKTSISETDKEDLGWFFKNNPDYAKFLPKEIPLKENAALIGKLVLEQSPLPSANDIRDYFKTATDVLRLITAMSDGDISLAGNTKFRNFKRSERRIILKILDNCANIEEDMLRHKNKWIRAGEILHPSEHVNRLNVYAAFDKLRNNIKIETYGGKLAESIDKKDYKKSLLLLSKRPGEFARKLDHMLRITDDPYSVVNSFKNAAPDVASPVLLQVKEHFANRTNYNSDIRVFFPKGSVSKAYGIENTLPPIDAKYCRAVVNICENALVEIYKKKDFMGNVYLSEEYKNYIVPFSQRSASKALKSIVRGSRFALEDDIKILRGFLWWKNGENRTDIDLSAAFYDDKWRYLSELTYYHLKNDEYGAYHSGDIVDAPNGASEFVDVDIHKAVGAGCRYMVFSFNSYTQQPYCDLPECFGGWMARKEPKSGEIYEPKTVQHKFDISTDCQICIPMIVDLVCKKVIWADMGLTKRPGWNNNVEANKSGIAATCKAVVKMKKPNLYDLIALHIKARGVYCDNKDAADIIFDVGDGITPFDTEIFMGEYL